MTQPGSKAQMGTAKLLALWLAIVGCMAVWVGAQRAVDRERALWPEAYPLLFLPNGSYLSAASLGFHVLLADVIYLWSIQYYGHRRTPEGRKYLWRIYTTIADLDPEFIDAYTTGALVMAADMSDPAMAVELLERGMESNPDSWQLPNEAGWYSYMSLQDTETAERYFELASQKPDAPSWTARLRAHMRVEQGDTLSAIVLWEEILEEAEASGDELAVAIASQRVPDLYSQYAIEEIEAAIELFETEQGRSPDSLALLTRLGLLPQTMYYDNEDRPLNWFEEPFVFDPATGKVTDPSAEKARTSR
jgi:tetratricopeptide (TPR) repeat protein